MKTFRQLMALLLVFVLVAACVPLGTITAFAADTGKFAGTGPVFYFSARLIICNLCFFAYSTVYTLPPDGLFR